MKINPHLPTLGSLYMSTGPFAPPPAYCGGGWSLHYVWPYVSTSQPLQCTPDCAPCIPPKFISFPFVSRLLFKLMVNLNCNFPPVATVDPKLITTRNYNTPSQSVSFILTRVSSVRSRKALAGGLQRSKSMLVEKLFVGLQTSELRA